MNYQPPPFVPLRFLPAANPEEILNLPISGINVVAHSPLPTNGNHWCLYLTINSKESVRVDMTPSYSVPSTVMPGGSKGNMIVSKLDDDDEFSISATKKVWLDVKDGLKVRDIVELLTGQNRHQYEFNDLGQGCRYWVTDQLRLLKSAQLVTDASQVREASLAILVEHPSGTQYPLAVGAYYV
ncbi:hypothetical protein FQN57_002752 [Myotisia sp. PD_48]|nr:hypothetical protein FQN57_002752 [Myotisia sp. PD_48]